MEGTTRQCSRRPRTSDPSWLPEAPDLPWPLKLPASVPETKYALSSSCVSVSSRSQSRPGISAPPWRAPAPPWRAPVSSAPPWRAPVSSAPPWRAPVSSAPPWWAPDLPESPPPTCQSRLRRPARVASADLPESPLPTCQSRLRRPARVASADLPESPHASADLPESPHASADLPESRHATAVYPVSLHVSAVSSVPPWWAPVSFAPHGPGPSFPPPVPPPLHRPPGLCHVCVKRLEAALWGGLCHECGCHSLTAHHPWTTSPIMHCTHTFPFTITPITQLSPFTH